jgi:Ca2+:H+ antiporter
VVVLLLVRAATDENGLLDVAKASILGSVLGNMLFVLGLSFLAGGLRHGTQKFTRTFGSLQSTMLVLAVAAISVPTLIAGHASSGEAERHIEGISLACAIVLFIVYLASFRFFMTDTEHSASDHGATTWSKQSAIGILALSAIGVGVVSEALVGSMEHTIETVGISEAFMGFILVPVVGNIAEHLVAVQLAWRNDMDFSITIALGSSVQVALGLAPLAVFLSYIIGNPLNLVFEPLQLVALVLATLIVPVVVSDGESTWIEGLQLLALYTLIAIGFWY